MRTNARFTTHRDHRDVSNVLSTWELYRDAAAFDQDINGWEVGAVTLRLNIENMRIENVHVPRREGLRPA